MAKTIQINHVITQIIKSGPIKPKSPIFSIFNDGDRSLYINNNFLVRPGSSFSIEVDAVVAMALEKDIKIENATQIDLHFIDDNVSNTRQSAQLIEVEIKKID